MGPTLSWERVGSRFYRSIDGPSLEWEIPDVSQCNVRAGPCGGVVVTWPRRNDDNVRVQRQNSRDGQSGIDLNLWSASGRKVGSIPLEGQVVDVVVSADENVVIVYASGLARRYTDFGANFSQLRLPSSVRSVCAYADGWVALTATDFMHVTWDDRVRPLSAIPAGPVRLWTLIPSAHDIGQSLQVLVSVNSADGEGASLVSFNVETGSRREIHQRVPEQIALSADGSEVAMIIGDHLELWGSDFFKQRRAIPLKNSNVGAGSSKMKLSWIGSDAIGLWEADTVSMWDVETGAFASFEYEEDIVAISEVDALRIIGTSTVSIIQRVSQSTVEALRVGSAAPPAVLLSCVDFLERGSPRANTNLRIIKDLPTTVDTCIAAAIAEIDPKWQKRLLRAAAFGKAAAPIYDPGPYTRALDTLRLLNTLREVADMFLTVSELNFLQSAVVMSRLERRGLYSTALAAASILRLPVEPVYVSWARDHIQKSVDKSDEEIEAEITAKLERLGRPISHRLIAQKALDEGRPGLATKLVDTEPVPESRVEMLLEMGEYADALDKATQSHDPNLVWNALLVLSHELSLPQFLRAIGDKTIAIQSYEDICRLRDRDGKALHDFLYQIDQRVRSLEIELQEISAEKSPTASEIRALVNKTQPFRQFSFVSKAAADWAQLSEIQQQLMVEYDTAEFVGSSAADTVYLLLKIGQFSRAGKIRTTLKIPDRQWWWLNVRALTTRRDWDALWSFSQSRRPPIGFKPFFDATFGAGAHDRAAVYAELATDLPIEERVRLILRAGDRARAVDVATRGRDPDLVSRVEADQG